MESYVNVDLHLRRMHCRAAGIWDEEHAVAFKARMTAVVDSMCAVGRPFTVMSDLTGLAVHSQVIAPIISDAAGQLNRVELDRYAMIAPQTLLRLQVRRLHPAPNLRFCDTRDEALAWVGWDERPVAILKPPAG